MMKATDGQGRLLKEGDTVFRTHAAYGTTRSVRMGSTYTVAAVAGDDAISVIGDKSVYDSTLFKLVDDYKDQLSELPEYILLYSDKGVTLLNRINSWRFNYPGYEIYATFTDDHKANRVKEMLEKAAEEKQ